MKTIEKIRTEIKRRTYGEQGFNSEEAEYGYRSCARDLLSFLDTLESETTYDTQQYTPRPSVGIEDVARVQFASHAKVFDKKRKAVFDWEQFKEVASIFYGFGKKDSSSTLESEKPTQEELKREIEAQLSIFPYTKVSPELPESRWIVIRKELYMFARHFAKWGVEHAKIDVTDFCEPIDPGIAQCIADHSWEMLGEDEKPVPNDLDFEQELYNRFGQIKDFTLGMRIGKYFYELGKQSGCSEIPNDLEEAAGEYEKNHTYQRYDGGGLTPEYNATLAEAVIFGAKWQKEQMMKEAVEGEVEDVGVNYIDLIDFDAEKLGLVEGDKVRVIVCKKEDEE